MKIVAATASLTGFAHVQTAAAALRDAAAVLDRDVTARIPARISRPLPGGDGTARVQSPCRGASGADGRAVGA